MSTLNHDTELEEILQKFKNGFLSTPGICYSEEKTTKALHTYLYKQTLELIGDDEEPGRTMGPGMPSFQRDSLRKQLRKAAAERWGQE